MKGAIVLIARWGPSPAMLALRHVTIAFFAPVTPTVQRHYTAAPVTYCQRRLSPFSTGWGPHVGNYVF